MNECVLQFEPKSRPSFAEIVVRLGRIMLDYETQQKQQQLQQQDSSCSSLPVDRVLVSAVGGARSEEVIPFVGSVNQENKDTTRHKKCQCTTMFISKLSIFNVVFIRKK